MGRDMRLCVPYQNRLAHFQGQGVKKLQLSLPPLSLPPSARRIPKLACRLRLIPCHADIAQQMIFHLRKATIVVPILNAAQKPALRGFGPAKP
jgi:hypothetical protein